MIAHQQALISRKRLQGTIFAKLALVLWVTKPCSPDIQIPNVRSLLVQAVLDQGISQANAELVAETNVRVTQLLSEAHQKQIQEALGAVKAEPDSDEEDAQGMGVQTVTDEDAEDVEAPPAASVPPSEDQEIGRGQLTPAEPDLSPLDENELPVPEMP